jgi:small-conductance mechanosensitive channel
MNRLTVEGMPAANSSILIKGVGASLSPVINKLALAVFILLLGFIAGRVLGLLAYRLLSGLALDKRLRRLGFKVSFERLISWLVSSAIYALTLFLSLNALGLTSTIVTFASLGILFTVGISFLLALKDFFPNLLAGLRIKLSGFFHAGDDIIIREVKGRVSAVGLLETRIELSSSEEVIVPNALFIKRKILVRRVKK